MRGRWTVTFDGVELDGESAMFAPGADDLPEPEARSAVESARSAGYEPELTTEPTVGWKRARLAWTTGHDAVVFEPLSMSVVYGIDEVAVCDNELRLLEWEPHEAPDPVCGCGFYIMRDRGELGTVRANTEGWVTLEVEASGVVLVHERGYRAQRQRVLGVHVDRRCHLCQGEDPVGLDPLVLLPVCGECVADIAPNDGVPWSLGDLAAALGTECSWGDPPPAPAPRASPTTVYIAANFTSFGVAMSQAAAAMQDFADKVAERQKAWGDAFERVLDVWSTFDEDDGGPERGTLARNRWARDRGLEALDRRHRRRVLVSDNRPCPGR